MGAHKYDKEVRQAWLFHAISQDTRNMSEHVASAPPGIVFMGAHKYDKLISIMGNSYSNHTVIHVFSAKSPREIWKCEFHNVVRR